MVTTQFPFCGAMIGTPVGTALLDLWTGILQMTFVIQKRTDPSYEAAGIILLLR